MQFLVLTRQFSAPPMDMVAPLLGATQEWVARHRASGKMTAVWAFAGTPNGGGVLEVDSHEELDEIVGEFPFGPFSTMEVIALSDLDRSLETAMRQATQAREAMGSAVSR